MNSERSISGHDVDRSSTRDLGHTSSYDVESYAAERAKPGLPSASAKKLAKGLGWFSFGLGLAELLAPRAIANISGVPNARTGLIRLYGLRELAAGVMIFAQENPAAGVWSRVAGDALDLASLGNAARSPNTNKGRLAFATASSTGAAGRLVRGGGRPHEGCRADRGAAPVRRDRAGTVVRCPVHHPGRADRPVGCRGDRPAVHPHP